MLINIISLGVGWLALHILAQRQCEDLDMRMGAEKQTPTSFFPEMKLVIADFGDVIGFVYLALSLIT